jgi:phospholipid/cholesterol/gamma-HCH transport system substrate-binding protein
MQAAGSPPPDPLPSALERKASALLLLLAVLVVASVGFVLHARGVFEPTQRLVLVADDSEGVQVGMDMTFSGFPIGRVQRLELADDGSTRILVDVPTRDARWLRSSSVFTLTRSLVGGTAIKAYSGILSDPPLPDKAERRLLSGDATAEIPRIMIELRTLVANLTAMTGAESALAGTLQSVQRLASRLEGRLEGQAAGQRGALDMLLGREAPKVVSALERTNRLLASLDGLVGRADGTLARVDQRLLGDQGLVVDSQAAVRQLQTLLGEARASLGRVDAVLKEAEGLARNARVASTDLGTLRAEVEASLRKVEQLVHEVNRLWPLRRDAEIKLP